MSEPELLRLLSEIEERISREDAGEDNWWMGVDEARKLVREIRSLRAKFPPGIDCDQPFIFDPLVGQYRNI